MGLNVVIFDAVNKAHIGYCDGMYQHMGDAMHILSKLTARYKKTRFNIVNVDSWDKKNNLISDIKSELE
jgi:DNA modification methylase